MDKEEGRLQTSGQRRRWWVVGWDVLALLVWYQPLSVGVTLVTIVGSVVLADFAARWNRTVTGVVQFPLQWGLLWVIIAERLFSVLLFLVAFLFFLVSVGQTIQTRNEAMLDRAEEIAEREGYESGCLITGAGHVSGMVATAQRDGLTVSRTYLPRWLRDEGNVVEEPEPVAGSDGTNRTAIRPQPQTMETPILRRIGAALVDSQFIVFFAMVMTLLLAGPMTDVSALFLSFLVVPWLYHFGFETFLGRTTGKRLLGITVMADDGSFPSPRALFLRNLLRSLDFVVFYGIGFLMMVLTDRRQRVGDAVAKTVVVKV